MSVESLYSSPLDAARTVMGQSEKDAAIRDYLTTGGQNLDPATTAWCAAFVNASLGKAGIEGTGQLNARSYLNWGQPVDQPQPGDVAVFSRGDPNGWQGHVGFYEGVGPDGRILVLGGNQGDSVSVAGYDPSTLLGYRRAPGGPAPVPMPRPPAEQGLGLAELYAASQKPREETAARDTARADTRKARQQALYGLSGMYE